MSQLSANEMDPAYERQKDIKGSIMVKRMRGTIKILEYSVNDWDKYAYATNRSGKSVTYS